MTITETSSEERARVLGHYDTAVRRSRKGRSTFVVTARRRRYLVGGDPVADAAWLGLDTGATDLARMDGDTLSALADAWINANDPEQTTRPCTCDDLTEDVPVLAGKGSERAMVWDTDAQRYATRTVRLRRCHCRPFPVKLGTDAMSWQELTPRTIDYRSERKVARPPARMRLRMPRARKEETFTPVEHADGSTTTYDAHGRIVAPYSDASAYWSGHVLIRRTASRHARSARKAAQIARSTERASWQDAADALAASMSAGATETTIAGVSVKLSAPDASGRFRATLTYIDGSTRSVRSRTVAPVARAILA